MDYLFCILMNANNKFSLLRGERGNGDTISIFAHNSV